MTDPDHTFSLTAFSEASQVLRGVLPLSAMPRLGGVLAEDSANRVSYDLRGDNDGRGGLFVFLSLTTVLPLHCQRCLQKFDFPLQVRRRFKLTATNAPEACDGEYELLEAGDARLGDFIEEELLLSLPFAPTHDLSDCDAARHIAA